MKKGGSKKYFSVMRKLVIRSVHRFKVNKDHENDIIELLNNLIERLNSPPESIKCIEKENLQEFSNHIRSIESLIQKNAENCEQGVTKDLKEIVNKLLENIEEKLESTPKEVICFSDDEIQKLSTLISLLISGKQTLSKGMSEPDEPALFITTQKTLPVLTTLMFGFSMGMLAIAATVELTPIILLSTVTNIDAAYILLGLSAMLFIESTASCVKSHGWDYYSISMERRDNENISKVESYIKMCLKRNKLWHLIAAYCYNIGLFTVLSGAAFLALSFSKIAALIITATIVANLYFLIFSIRRPKKSIIVAEFLIKLFKIN